MPANHERALNALFRRGRLRTLKPRSGVDFASNDYLALAESAELKAAAIAAIERGVPLGAGGSRLLRGNHEEHEALEAEAAEFFGAESALYFGGGFSANTAIVSTAPARGDLIVYDELIHASVHDGMRLSRADCRAARHNDPQSFDDEIQTWRTHGGGGGQVWIAIESLYSMDGDRAPLADFAQIAARRDAMLIIDEAHATGVFGRGGRGFASELEGAGNVVSLHTCGKALGAAGALVLAPKTIRDYLVNRARPFIYATAPSPLMAAVVRAALKIVRDEPKRRQQLHDLIAHTERRLRADTPFQPSGSQVQPIIVGADDAATSLAAAMQARGFDMRAIRPPTVPEGTARLRMTLTLHATNQTVDAAIDALVVAGAERAA